MAATIFANVRIIDGSGIPPFSGEVRVEGDRIAALARDGAQLPREGARIIDGAGATLMPGLVEAHAHVSLADLPDIAALGDIPPEEDTLLAAAGSFTRKPPRLNPSRGLWPECCATGKLDKLGPVLIDALQTAH
jgi:imidazolonepropionase-like amidohydrolase